MTAPNINVLLSSGETAPLDSLYSDSPIALVFLRHFGCPFCKRLVDQLTRRPHLNVVFVGMGDVVDTRRFAESRRVVHPFICDPDRKLYESFGLGRANFRQIFNSRTLTHGLAAISQGYLVGRPNADPAQLDGSFVIDTDGRVVWSYRARDLAGNASPTMIEEALAGVGAKAGV